MKKKLTALTLAIIAAGSMSVAEASACHIIYTNGVATEIVLHDHATNTTKTIRYSVLYDLIYC